MTTSSAVPMQPPGLPVLHDDRLEHVGRVAAGVHGLFEALVDVLPADHLEWVGARHEEARDAVVKDAVANVLELPQLAQMSPRVLEALEQRDRVGELPRRAPNDLRLLASLQ